MQTNKYFEGYTLFVSLNRNARFDAQLIGSQYLFKFLSSSTFSNISFSSSSIKPEIETFGYRVVSSLISLVDRQCEFLLTCLNDRFQIGESPSNLHGNISEYKDLFRWYFYVWEVLITCERHRYRTMALLAIISFSIAPLTVMATVMAELE